MRMLSFWKGRAAVLSEEVIVLLQLCGLLTIIYIARVLSFKVASHLGHLGQGILGLTICLVSILALTVLWKKSSGIVVTTVFQHIPSFRSLLIIFLGTALVVCMAVILRSIQAYSTEQFKIGLKIGGMYEWSVYDQDDGVVVVEGFISTATSKELTRLLQENGEIKELQLNSNGGTFTGAIQMANIVYSNGLATSSRTACISFCSIPFLAGTSRIAYEESRFGFHRSGFPGQKADTSDLVTAATKTYFLTIGIEDEFVEKAIAVPFDNIWFPSLDELQKASFFTHIRTLPDDEMRPVDEYCGSVECE